MSHYNEEFDIQNYWNLRHQAWAESPDWGVFPYKQTWFDIRFGHLLPIPEKPSGSVLDYGCGAGLYAAPLLLRFEQYVGFDTSPAAIDVAYTYYTRFPELLKRMTLSSFNGAPGTWGESLKYDLVLSVTVLQHQPISFRLAMVENIKRLLKPGGRYIGLEMAGNSMAGDMPPILEDAWRRAWLPLVIERDIPQEHPEWIGDDVWVAQ